MPTTDESLTLANELADMAREFLKEGRNAFGPTQFKDDGTPVTPADIECEKKMRALLEKKAPTDAVWGEELGKGQGDRLWVLDPIDGTKAFVSGSPLYCSLIGLLEQGTATVGIIELPMLGRRFAGVTEGAFCRSDNEIEVACKPSETVDLSKASLATTRPMPHQGAQLLTKTAGILRYGGDAFNYGCVADGSLDIALDHDMQPHDFVPLLPVIRSAGAVACDFEGNEPEPHQPCNLIAAGNRQLLDKALELINSA